MERLKLDIKNRVIQDWQSCIWLADEQSQELALELYRRIHITENRLREFITIYLNTEYGFNWWEEIVSKKIKDKYKSRYQKYKQDVPAFNNVNDYLLGIDVDDLMGIMETKNEKWVPAFNQTIEDRIKEGNEKNILEILKSQLVTDTDLWQECFSNYLGQTFPKEWGNFYRNRNHIAHNKVIDYSAFKKIDKSITSVEELIISGSKKYILERFSEEEKTEILYEAEFEEHLEKDIISRKESDAGIRIWNYEEILDKFNEIIDSFIADIENRIYFRNGIEIYSNKLEKGNPLLRVDSEISTTSLEINATYGIDDSEGGTSNLTLSLMLNNDEIETCEIILQNGEVEYSSERGYYMPLTEDFCDAFEVEDFINKVIEIINEEIPNIEEPLLIKVDYGTTSQLVEVDRTFRITDIEDSNGVNLTKFVVEGKQYKTIKEVLVDLGLDPEIISYEEIPI